MPTSLNCPPQTDTAPPEPAETVDDGPWNGVPDVRLDTIGDGREMG